MLDRTGEPLRVAVLAGGDSAEREVSLRSGAAVAQALQEAGHQVCVLDPAEFDLAQLNARECDVCFLALHGGAGEDGRVQARLESLGIPYTGSGPQASALAMDKAASKQRFVAAGVPTPRGMLIPDEMPLETATVQAAELGFPLIVKPNAEGSSIGLAVAADREQLSEALRQARQHAGGCLVERLIRGREFTVAVLDGEALPLLEIIPASEVFSYQAKYQSPQTRYVFDFELADERRAEISRHAVQAARALGTEGLVRVDVMLDDAGPWVLEVNTIPGMTARSLAPQAAARAGLEMPALCNRLVRGALAKAGGR